MVPKNSTAEKETEVWHTACPEPFSADEFKITEGEKRLTVLHYVRHSMAVIVIVAYVGMIVYSFINPNPDLKVPEAFMVLVSAIVGFYFGKKE